MPVLSAPKGLGERVLMRRYGRRVFEEDFEYTGGRKEEFFLFGASKTPVFVLPVTKDGFVVLVRQFRHATREFVLEIPGGNPKDVEHPERVALEELAEETGYRPMGRVIPLGGPGWIDPASWRVQGLMYLALDCEKVGEPNPDRTEVMEVVLVPLAAWVHACLIGEVSDYKSIAITMRALIPLGYDPLRTPRASWR